MKRCLLISTIRWLLYTHHSHGTFSAELEQFWPNSFSDYTSKAVGIKLWVTDHWMTDYWCLRYPTGHGHRVKKDATTLLLMTLSIANHLTKYLHSHRLSSKSGLRSSLTISTNMSQHFLVKYMSLFCLTVADSLFFMPHSTAYILMPFSGLHWLVRASLQASKKLHRPDVLHNGQSTVSNHWCLTIRCNMV